MVIVLQRVRVVLHALFACFLPGSFKEISTRIAVTWIYLIENELITVHSHHILKYWESILQILKSTYETPWVSIKKKHEGLIPSLSYICKNNT